MKAVLASLFLCFGLWGQAPTPAPDNSTLQALLQEVHELRLALERSTLIGPRVEIAVQRLRLQQEQVTRTTGQLYDARREIDQAIGEQNKTAAQVEGLGKESQESTDPARRQSIESIVKQLKFEGEQQQKSLESLRSREAELSARLQTEQASLDELRSRLDRLEQSLEPPK
ncbi:MAG TPA: hypothetical protein VKU01_06135 [Bryobacteraceae bacterium]|nr:hypothetical protein [Bryobacteraceae bacterium]